VIISTGSLGSGIVLTNTPKVIIITNEHVVHAPLSVDGKPSVVTIFYDDGLNDSQFEPERFINCMKKPDATRWCAALHRQLRYATVVTTDADRDLALLQVDGAPPNLPAATPANESEALDPGKPVAVIGHPKGFLWTYTTGIVSNAERHRPDNRAPFIQTQAPINPGNSGGPMFGLDRKLDGKLVGVIQSKYASSEGLNFAISVKDVMTFARPQLKAP